MTFVGRAVNYFRPGINRVLPEIAVFENGGWKKKSVFVSTDHKIVSDKDAFLTNLDGLMLFHRIHTVKEEFYCVAKVPDDVLNKKAFSETALSDSKILINPAEFEDRRGWSAPMIKVGEEYLLILHGIDKETQWYKAFAALLNEHGEIVAVTRQYIMEPKESYEVYGDRPFTVFPCGICKVGETLLISYGAADFAYGIGEIDLSELMSMLDANRV